MPASAIQIAKIVVDFILSLPRNWEKSIVVDTEELASRIREWPGPELASCVGAESALDSRIKSRQNSFLRANFGKLARSSSSPLKSSNFYGGEGGIVVHVNIIRHRSTTFKLLLRAKS
jgi:hypothetical protein